MENNIKKIRKIIFETYCCKYAKIYEDPFELRKELVPNLIKKGLQTLAVQALFGTFVTPVHNLNLKLLFLQLQLPENKKVLHFLWNNQTNPCRRRDLEPLSWEVYPEDFIQFATVDGKDMENFADLIFSSFFPNDKEMRERYFAQDKYSKDRIPYFMPLEIYEKRWNRSLIPFKYRI